MEINLLLTLSLWVGALAVIVILFWIKSGWGKINYGKTRTGILILALIYLVLYFCFKANELLVSSCALFFSVLCGVWKENRDSEEWSLRNVLNVLAAIATIIGFFYMVFSS